MKYLGDVDVFCEYCRTEQAVAVNEGDTHWFCAYCEEKHVIPEEDGNE